MPDSPLTADPPADLPPACERDGASRRLPDAGLLPDAEHLPAALAAALARLSERLNIDGRAAALAEKPGENTLALLGLSTLLFFAAERGKNPKVGDIWDSLVYCSTCLSVGYGDIFAHTPLGKIVGSALMTVGPALSSRALDGPASAATDAKQSEILATLKQILAELKTRA